MGYAVDQIINYNVKAFQYHDRWKNIRKEDFCFKVNYDTVNKDTGDKGDHVNYTGAKKTTKFIGKYLNEKKYLPSHKEDEIHKTWDKQYEEYKKIVE